ncbi:MAG TPA: nuclear transport factor 2 family protein, partial [Sphingomicrobium sp.]|nr:nuclear transport factor 2 family protein [Sphingomicrobium sp.]
MSLILLAVSLAVSGAQPKPPASLEAQLIARERASWSAWQKKDVAFWRRHLSADHVEIDGPGGPQDRNYVLKGVAGRTCTVPRYKLGNFTFRRLGADAGMLVYKAEQEFACGD